MWSSSAVSGVYSVTRAPAPSWCYQPRFLCQALTNLWLQHHPRLYALSSRVRFVTMPDVTHNDSAPSGLATVALEDSEILHDTRGCKVERRGAVAIKSGPAVTMHEANAQRLAESLGLPVPHVHSVEKLRKGYSITMDFVPGQRLDKVWETMSLDEKKTLCAQLKAVLITMHACTGNTTGMIGSCDGGIVQDLRRYSSYTSEALPDEAAFNNFLLDLIRGTPQPVAAELGRGLRTDHRVVFTHADLAQHNIIMQDNKLAAIIDWQFSGWYPEYWEYIKFFERIAASKDWKDMAHEIFPRHYDAELIHYHALIRWQYP